MELRVEAAQLSVNITAPMLRRKLRVDTNKPWSKPHALAKRFVHHLHTCRRWDTSFATPSVPDQLPAVYRKHIRPAEQADTSRPCHSHAG